jgi:hypothetical protein
MARQPDRKETVTVTKRPSRGQPKGDTMSAGADNIITVPADLIDAVREGLYIAEFAATAELRRNANICRTRPRPDLYQFLLEARAFVTVIGRERPAAPTPVQVSLDEHRRSLLAALHHRLEADARALGQRDASRYPHGRNRVIGRLDALAGFISHIEASGSSDDDVRRPLDEMLQIQLEQALEDLGYDEDRGDWWRVTYDGGEDGWGIKGEIGGRDVNFDVTTAGYTLA